MAVSVTDPKLLEYSARLNSAGQKPELVKETEWSGWWERFLKLQPLPALLRRRSLSTFKNMFRHTSMSNVKERKIECSVSDNDPRKLRKKIQKVEVAIFQRAQTLSFGRDHLEEREALVDAIGKLRELQRERSASIQESS